MRDTGQLNHIGPGAGVSRSGLLGWFCHRVPVWLCHDVLCFWPQFPSLIMKGLTRALPSLSHAAEAIMAGWVMMAVVNQGFLSSFQDVGSWGGRLRAPAAGRTTALRYLRPSQLTVRQMCQSPSVSLWRFPGPKSFSQAWTSQRGLENQAGTGPQHTQVQILAKPLDHSMTLPSLNLGFLAYKREQ